MEFEFIDPRNTPKGELQSRGELPHLYKEGGSYFVTFRLLDAVETKAKPGSRDGCTTKNSQHGSRDGCTTTRRTEVVSLRQDKQTRTPAGDSVRIAQETEPPLRLGACLLARPEIAELTQNALRHFHSERYYLSAWCVMPNHVHTVITPTDGWQLSAILHSWKSFTAHQANRLLKRRGVLWERESFDHLIRTLAHFEAFVDYVEHNPVEARFCHTPEEWRWSSAWVRNQQEAAGTAAPQRTASTAAETAAPQRNQKNAAGTAAPQKKDR